MRIVEDSQSRLVLRDRTSFVSIIFVAAALLLATFALSRGEGKAWGSAILFMIFAVAFFHNSKVTFDKAARSCVLERRDMWRASRTTIPFETITNVVVEPMIVNDQPKVTPCRLSLLTREGPCPLSASYEPDIARYQNMRDEVAKAIFGPSSPTAPDPIRALVEARRPIDAIAVLRRRDGIGLNEAKERIDKLRKEVDGDHS